MLVFIFYFLFLGLFRFGSLVPFFFFFFFFFFFANTGEDTLFEIDYKIHIIDMDIML